MSTGQWDDPEYPYLPRYRAASQPFAEPRPSAFPWKTILRWLTRAVLATGALVLVTLIVLTAVCFRAGQQAWLLAGIEKDGVDITYWHQSPTNQDSLSETWRDFLGDHWWSEPREIVYSVDGNWTGLWGYHAPTEEDLQRFCASAGRFQRLKSLTIASDHFSCDQIQHWPSLAQIEDLKVESTRLSDDDLAIIGKMTALKTLRIAKAKITTKGLASLSRLPGLESLTLDQIEIKTIADQPASGFASLKILSIQNSPSFDDEALLAMGNLPALEDAVNFHCVPLGDGALAHVLQSGLIRSLSVGEGNRLTNQCFAELAQHTAPSWLMLSGPSLTDEGLIALEGKQFPTLILTDTGITDQAFASLAKIQGLDHLDLTGAKVSGLGLKLLPAELKLRTLDLSRNPLTPEGIELVAKTPCEDLTLFETQLTDEQLLLFVDRDDLTNLNVSSTQVTADGVKAFYEARKRRLKEAGREESLHVICDFPEEAEPYFNPWGRTDFSIDSEMFSVEP